MHPLSEERRVVFPHLLHTIDRSDILGRKDRRGDIIRSNLRSLYDLITKLGANQVFLPNEHDLAWNPNIALVCLLKDAWKYEGGKIFKDVIGFYYTRDGSFILFTFDSMRDEAFQQLMKSLMSDRLSVDGPVIEMVPNEYEYEEVDVDWEECDDQMRKDRHQIPVCLHWNKSMLPKKERHLCVEAQMPWYRSKKED